MGDETLRSKVLAEAILLEDSAWLSNKSQPETWSVGHHQAPHFAHTIVPKSGDDDVLAVFRKFDVDGNGTLSGEELASLLQELDPVNWTQDSVAELFRIADVNHDGDIDIEEFVSFVFYEEAGKTVVNSVFDAVPDELRTRLRVASQRRMKIIIHITPNDLNALKDLETPPQIIVLAMAAVCWLLFERGASDLRESWRLALELCFLRPREFLQGLIDPPWNISRSSLAKAEELADDSNFNHAALHDVRLSDSVCEDIIGLVDWVLAVIDVHRAFLAFGPLPERLELAQPADLTYGTSVTAEVTKPWASAVACITRKDIDELKAFQHPPQLVQLVLSAVCWILRQQGHPDAYMSWRLSRNMMGNPRRFMSQLMHPPKVSQQVLEQVENVIRSGGDNFNVERAHHVSKCLAALVEWVFLVLQLERKALEFGAIDINLTKVANGAALEFRTTQH